MAETITVEQDDSFYWAAGSEFVEVLVDFLNRSLEGNGIANMEQRQKICSQFLFGIGIFLDQYWMEVAGKKCHPLLCFTENFLDTGVSVKEVEPLSLPVSLPIRDFEFHGAAAGVAEEYFGPQNEQLSFRVGPVGEE